MIENEETTEGIVAGVLEDIMNQVCTGKTKIAEYL